ncbi:hypothetical protein GCM10010174_12380 [Kutzneria viridogrisea]|uniref:Uncharacterized protein n=1 Tax=Kutzneria viridogrisea TaxID=47990 RepID=A0ABR6BHR5_9PSEU|nr:hypothetical protein [Kutzneria viridogrisea]
MRRGGFSAHGPSIHGHADRTGRRAEDVSQVSKGLGGSHLSGGTLGQVGSSAAGAHGNMVNRVQNSLGRTGDRLRGHSDRLRQSAQLFTDADEEHAGRLRGIRTTGAPPPLHGGGDRIRRPPTGSGSDMPPDRIRRPPTGSGGNMPPDRIRRPPTGSGGNMPPDRIRRPPTGSGGNMPTDGTRQRGWHEIPPPHRTDRYDNTKPLRDEYRHETDPNHPDNPFGSRVLRLSREEREQRRVFFDERGVLRRASNGERYDTSSGSSAWGANSNSNDGRAIFTMDRQGNLYASNYHEVGRYHHSTLAGGHSVASAGELSVTNGRVNYATAASGHYRPGPDQMANLADTFGRNGVRAPIYDFKGPGNGATPLFRPV